MAREPGKLSRRINQRVGRFTSKVDAYRTPLGILVLAVGAFLAYVAFISTTGPPFQGKYRIEVSVPADAPTLRVGQAVRIGGRLAGLISEIEPDRVHHDAKVTASITKTGFRPIPEDSTAFVRVHSIVYSTYLELRPGDSKTMLSDGDTLKAPATHGVDLLQVVQLFDQRAREDLSKTLINTGYGVAGRGADLNGALADLPELSRNAASELRAANSHKGALARLVSGGAGTANALKGKRADDVGALITSSDEVISTVARRREELRQTIRLLRPFEDELLKTAPIADPLLRDSADLTRRLRPTVRAVTQQLPRLDHLFGLGDVLHDEFFRVADVADPVIDSARPIVYGLFPTMTALKPLDRDLANLKATVKPYKPEIAQAGKRLADATNDPAAQGLKPGAVAGRVVPVLTPHTCNDPLPDPGQAQQDSC